MHIGIRGPYAQHSSSIDTMSRAEEGASASSTPEAVSDPITEVAVLLAQSFREDRKRALDASDAAEAARVREAEQQVQAMKEKASSLRAEGWIKGTSMALSGGFSAVGALGSIGKSEAIAMRTMTACSSTGKVGEGIGTGFASSYEATAQKHQGEADLHDARARAYNVASERYGDEAAEAQRMVRKVMEFLEEVKENRNAARGAASSIRG